MFKQANINPYALFVKRSFAEEAKGVSGEGLKKGCAVAKYLGQEWKAMGKAGQAKCAAAAARVQVDQHIRTATRSREHGFSLERAF